MGREGRNRERQAFAVTALCPMPLNDARQFVRSIGEQDAASPEPKQSKRVPVRELLGVDSSSVDMKKLMKSFADLTPSSALQVIEAALPVTPYSYGTVGAEGIVRAIARLLRAENVVCFNNPTNNNDRAEMGRSVDALFQAAGLPALDGLNADERTEALERVPRPLAQAITLAAPDLVPFRGRAFAISGVRYKSPEWEALVHAATAPQRLEMLASRALPEAKAWREVCTRLELAQFQNLQKQPNARERVAMEALCRENIPESLLLATGINAAMLKRAQVRVDAQRALAHMVRRPDLAKRYDTASVQQLSSAAVAHASLHRKNDPEMEARIGQLLRTVRGESKGRETTTLAL
jgi:hypothetical protein